MSLHGKEQAGQKEIPNVQTRERKHTREFNDGAKACAERDSDPVRLKKESGPPRQDPTQLILQEREWPSRTRPHPADPATAEWKRPSKVSTKAAAK